MTSISLCVYNMEYYREIETETHTEEREREKRVKRVRCNTCTGRCVCMHLHIYANVNTRFPIPKCMLLCSVSWQCVWGREGGGILAS